MPSCQYLVTGVDGATGAQPFIYAPPGFNVYGMMLLPTTGGTSTAAVTFEQWGSPGGTSVYGGVAFTFASGMGTMMSAPILTAANNTGGAWLRPSILNMNTSSAVVTVGLVITSGTAAYVANAANTGVVTITPTASSPSYQPLTVPSDFGVSTIPWSDTRVVAGEMRAQNVTSVLNRGGSYTCARIVPEDTPITGWTNALVTASNPRDKLYAPADQPLTTFLMPGSDVSNFYDCTYSTVQGSTGIVSRLPVMALSNPQPFQAVIITVPGAQTLALQPEIHLEFRNQRSLFQLGYSNIHVETMNNAAIRLAAMPPFHSGAERREREPGPRGPPRNRQGKQNRRKEQVSEKRAEPRAQAKAPRKEKKPKAEGQKAKGKGKA
jgi:hypothetical protein